MGHVLIPGSWIVLPRSCQDGFLHVVFLFCVLLKSSSSRFILISSSQRSMTLLAPFVIFPKDYSFTCIFHSLGELLQTIYNALFSCFVFHLLSIRSIRKQKFHNQTYIHLYTVSSIHKYIWGRSLSGDLLPIIIPF